MSEILNAGKGQCHGTASLLIRPIQAVIELGASGDVLTKTLKAVHHANRHGSPDNFIAVSLPSMRVGRNCMLPGYEIELIGSEASLSHLMDSDGLQSLMRRGMLRPLEIEETFLEPGTVGAAYVRDRSCEKHTKGWIRRNRVRAERRGKAWKETDIYASGNDRTVLRLQYGTIVIHVRQIIGEIRDSKLMVNTYGFSSPSPDHQAILPVYPEAARESDNAA
ncbi:MAG: hypothetical protein OXC68_09525 [Aestuariivita sp.]|nr:hypothetical protein [Aestuariivita sp.]